MLITLLYYVTIYVYEERRWIQAAIRDYQVLRSSNVCYQKNTKNVIVVLPLNRERACLFHWNLETLIYTGPQDPTFFYNFLISILCSYRLKLYWLIHHTFISILYLPHKLSISCAAFYPLSCEFVCCLCLLTVVQFKILILRARTGSHFISCMLSNWTGTFLRGRVCVCVLMY